MPGRPCTADLEILDGPRPDPRRCVRRVGRIEQLVTHELVDEVGYLPVGRVDLLLLVRIAPPLGECRLHAGDRLEDVERWVEQDATVVGRQLEDVVHELEGVAQVKRRPVVELVRVACEPAQRAGDEDVDQAVRPCHRDVLGRAISHVEEVLQDVGVIGAVHEIVQELDHVRAQDVEDERRIEVEVLPIAHGTL